MKLSRNVTRTLINENVNEVSEMKMLHFRCPINDDYNNKMKYQRIVSIR